MRCSCCGAKAPRRRAPCHPYVRNQSTRWHKKDIARRQEKVRGKSRGKSDGQDRSHREAKLIDKRARERDHLSAAQASTTAEVSTPGTKKEVSTTVKWLWKKNSKLSCPKTLANEQEISAF